MKQNIMQIRKSQRQKEMQASKKEALTEYERCQAEIMKLLKQIEAGIEKHDRNASGYPGGHNWGDVGDLAHFKSELQEVSDQLNGRGEYARVH